MRWTRRLVALVAGLLWALLPALVAHATEWWG